MKRPDPYMKIARLIAKSLKEELTTEESAWLEAWVTESAPNRAIYDRLMQADYLEEQLSFWEHHDAGTYWPAMAEAIAQDRSRWRRTIQGVRRYAAVLLPLILVCGAGWYWISHFPRHKAEAQHDSLAGVHIMPRGKVAQLVLGSGRVINLNDSVQEVVTEKDGTHVRNKASALSYVAGNQHSGTAVYNTLITPRGGEYQVTLSDGTKVWLNTASSLRFPTRFQGKQREVTLTGEAYFEVAKDEKHPFIVRANNTKVTVLGTKFNISAYADDPGQKITLTEGSVRVHNDEDPARSNNGVLLKPGYQAVFFKDNHHIDVAKANLEATLAWKNGLFLFDGESLGSIMRTLSRWYDVHVVYADGVDTRFHFTGRIHRYENITGILHLLELTGKVEFSMNGRQLEVVPHH
jgi:ferric-dicitrate binding protein FerR (iron transport regulator)